jgi:glycosyltransferase involved in cell wall biosynthesis
MLAAYNRLSEGPGIEPHPHLVIVGDGEERAALEKEAADTGFNGIRFCGFRNQSELPRFFDIASVFVFTASSWAVGFNCEWGGDDPELHLVMAGPDQQQWSEELQQTAERGGIADRIHW